MTPPYRASASPLRLVRPAIEHVPSYLDALARGFSPDNTRPDAGGEEASRVADDADAFLASLDDRDARGAPIRLPDGSTIARLPGLRLWMWDGDFCGSVGLRWQPGTPELPPAVLGHAGYAVVEWKRRRGYATEALRQLLPVARSVGLPWIDLTSDLDNVASQRVMLANGAQVVDYFDKPGAYGATPAVRMRIVLDG